MIVNCLRNASSLKLVCEYKNKKKLPEKFIIKATEIQKIGLVYIGVTTFSCITSKKK